MRSLDYLNGCLDAGDISGAAACILADPVSQFLQRNSIAKLFEIAYVGRTASRCDVIMVEIVRDFMAGMATL